MSNRISAVENILLVSVDSNKYDCYRCKKHGVFACLKSVEVVRCPGDGVNDVLCPSNELEKIENPLKYADEHYKP